MSSASQRPIKFAAILPELSFSTSRSSGPGGQNVNKVNSKVTLRFDVLKSSALDADQKNHILQELSSRIVSEGVLMIISQDSRSQAKNKEDVISKLDRLLKKAFTPKRLRKATKPNKAAKQARINNKKRRSEKKQWRQRL